MTPDTDLLRITDLQVAFRTAGGKFLPVIDTANLVVHSNESVGILGESGSGKTMLCRSIIGTLQRRRAVITGGQIVFAGRNIANAPESLWRRIRGHQIGYVPQSSLAGLNPVLTVETQLVEALTVAQSMDRQDARREARRLLEVVQIPRVDSVLKERSVQLSGGMRQRVMIAAAVSQHPRLLVADEPTTALDVTVQDEILSLMRALQRDLGMALILVSHDLSVIEKGCDSIMVMYAGATVETGPVHAISAQPHHPYSRALQQSRVDRATPERDLQVITGDPPSLGAWPSGCRFWPRCSLVADACREDGQPRLRPLGTHLTACIRAERMESE